MPPAGALLASACPACRLAKCISPGSEWIDWIYGLDGFQLSFVVHCFLIFPQIHLILFTYSSGQDTSGNELACFSNLTRRRIFLSYSKQENIFINASAASWYQRHTSLCHWLAWCAKLFNHALVRASDTRQRPFRQRFFLLRKSNSDKHRLRSPFSDSDSNAENFVYPTP